jgi:hypothetical protein
MGKPNGAVIGEENESHTDGEKGGASGLARSLFLVPFLVFAQQFSALYCKNGECTWKLVAGECTRARTHTHTHTHTHT